MKPITIRQIKSRLLHSDDLALVDIVKIKRGERTFETCWLLPEGYTIDCTNHDHDFIADEIKVGFYKAFKRNWVRKGDICEYHFIRNDVTIKITEEDMLREIPYLSNEAKYFIDIEPGKAGGETYSYEFTKTEFKENGFKLERFLTGRYQVHPKVLRKNIEDTPCSYSF